MTTQSLSTLSKVWGHFKTICLHKFWVFYYCCQAGIIWRGIKHDLSKFSLTEFWESVKYYTGTCSPIVLCKADKGVSKAWLHHKGRNTHHYEYWQDNFDSDTPSHIRMPEDDFKEMICDYMAAGRAYMKDKFTYEAEYEWWQTKKRTIKTMNEYTLRRTDMALGLAVQYKNLKFLKNWNRYGELR